MKRNEFRPYQLDAIERLKSGSILVADVGVGKSRTALGWYYLKICQGELNEYGYGIRDSMKSPKDLYVICPAKKRDSLDWQNESLIFGIGENPELSTNGVKLVVDSWNKIHDYIRIKNAVFIFDEQKTVSYGKWSRDFIRIAKNNDWIMLTATPADTPSDLMAVFIANGFFTSKSDFIRKHAILSPYVRYEQITGYRDEHILKSYERQIMVVMTGEKPAVQHHIDIRCKYDRKLYKTVWKDRWDPFEDCPIRETGRLFYLLRRVANADQSRIDMCKTLIEKRHSAIIFYNFDYELEILREIGNALGITVAEWNGHKHEACPETGDWIYLVQYSGGAEAWNCTSTDSVIFYSQNYSYRIMAQAAGRIDRMNTKFVDLYYYHLTSSCPIDLAIARALARKKKFNQAIYLNKHKR